MINFIKSWFNKKKAFCLCGNELLGDKKSILYEGASLTHIVCSKCNCQSDWYLDTIIPILVGISK